MQLLGEKNFYNKTIPLIRAFYMVYQFENHMLVTKGQLNIVIKNLHGYLKSPQLF